MVLSEFARWAKVMWWLLCGDCYGGMIWFFREHTVTVVWSKHLFGCIIGSWLSEFCVNCSQVANYLPSL